MDIYKLTYFNLRGIAEPIRLLFKYANVPFEDILVESQTWPEVQKTFKWQQLPFLEHQGRTLSQSIAILRYLSQRFGLTPEDPWENAQCDEIAGAVNDLRLKIKPLILAKFVEQNAKETAKLREELLSNAVPLYLQNLHDILSELRCDDPKRYSGDFIFSEKPVWADFWLAHFTESWTGLLEDSQLLEKYPLLKAQQRAVFTLPRVADWIESRPEAFI